MHDFPEFSPPGILPLTAPRGIFVGWTQTRLGYPHFCLCIWAIDWFLRGQGYSWGGFHSCRSCLLFWSADVGCRGPCVRVEKRTVASFLLVSAVTFTHSLPRLTLPLACCSASQTPPASVVLALLAAALLRTVRSWHDTRPFQTIFILSDSVLDIPCLDRLRHLHLT